MRSTARRALVSTVTIAAVIGLCACDDAKSKAPSTTVQTATSRAANKSKGKPSATASATNKAKAAPLVKIAGDKVDEKQKASAKKFAEEYLLGHAKGKFEPLGDEVVKALKDKLTPENQKKGYEALKGVFGKFESMEFVEAVKITQGAEMIAYRFRGKFAKSKPEIRVVFDKNGKISGFFIKHWKDEMS